MRLTEAERAMLDGHYGPAKARAMELLVRYGEALGAERLVKTKNVAGTVGSATPFMRAYAERGFDAVFSEFNLDSREVVETPPMEVGTCQLISGIDMRNWQHQGVSRELVETQERSERFFASRGVKMMATCTPYQVGNVPVRDEHCAWMESSAVVYCNAVLGARTNTEGRESTGAASLTGRIPYWGYHCPEMRRATDLVDVRVPVSNMLEWGLLGYHVGEVVQDEVPALAGVCGSAEPAWLKHFGAAASSSGGIEMYHIAGITPEAPDLETAFGGNKPRRVFDYNKNERRSAYENLNSSARDSAVNFVMLGCPHVSAEQLVQIAALLDGKRLNGNCALWVHAPRDIRDSAQSRAAADTIRRAGAIVMSDTCPAISRAMPPGTAVVATDSAKQAHYLPALTGVQTWFGSLDDCVEAATSGRWSGELR
jgi:predicted aconitase